MKPRVLVIGSWEPAALAKSYCAGFRAAACVVDHFDPASGGPEQGRLAQVGIRIAGLRDRLWDLWQDRLFERATAWHPDMVLVLKGHWLEGGTIRTIRDKTGAAMVNFFPDDPFHDPILGVRLHRAAGAYDRFYTFAHAFVPRLIGLGARAGYLPFAWDPAMHPPATRLSRELCEVSFVGNWSEDREEWLEHLSGFDLGLWGHWGRLSRCTPLRKSVRGPPQLEGDMVSILSRSAITMNLIRVVCNGHNMRSYDALGIGAFLLSNRTPELTTLFRDGEDLACFSTPAELKEKVQYYLAHDQERMRIAESGHARVLSETYNARALTILHEVFHGQWPSEGRTRGLERAT